MKILEEKYPMGTFKYQKTPGRYIEQYLYDNLKSLAEVIVNDMTFLGIGFSSTLEVGTGKSCLFTQIGEAWTDLMNKTHGLNLTFTQKNIVFRPKDLIERAFELPKYSCILVDEWEDAHYWSELATTLRKFFRKCRQLNLFILIIIPNYFQLPINYALGRSIFAIDVKFKGQFERGFFSFYDFESKRDLYIKGKRFHNYHVTKPSFPGEFGDGYGIPEAEYRKAKEDDLKRTEIEEGTPEINEFKMKILLLRKLYDNRDMIDKEGFSTTTLSHIFETAKRTMDNWMVTAKRENEKIQEIEKVLTRARMHTYNTNNPKIKDPTGDEMEREIE